MLTKRIGSLIVGAVVVGSVSSLAQAPIALAAEHSCKVQSTNPTISKVWPGGKLADFTVTFEVTCTFAPNYIGLGATFVTTQGGLDTVSDARFSPFTVKGGQTVTVTKTVGLNIKNLKPGVPLDFRGGAAATYITPDGIQRTTATEVQNFSLNVKK